MTRLEKLAAWVWDNLPGGVPTQLWLWGLAPRVAERCEALADERDNERTSSA